MNYYLYTNRINEFFYFVGNNCRITLKIKIKKEKEKKRKSLRYHLTKEEKRKMEMIKDKIK